MSVRAASAYGLYVGDWSPLREREHGLGPVRVCSVQQLAGMLIRLGLEKFHVFMDTCFKLNLKLNQFCHILFAAFWN